MATSVITGTIQNPTGVALANVSVTARVLPRPVFVTATGIELAPIYSTTTNASGVYTLTLTRTADITPTGSYYEITEYIPDHYGGPVKHTIQVGAGNTTVYASLVNVPPVPGSTSYLTLSSGDARYQQIAGYGVSGDLSTIDLGDTANSGALATAARSDHQHALSSLYLLRAGDLVVSARSAAGADELLCDGTAVSRTTYAVLFAAISTTYGVGDGSTTFNVPDFKGRTIIGAGTGSGLTARTRGQTSGVETHPLVTGELASHGHTFSGTTVGNGDHTHGLSSIKYAGAGAAPLVGSTGDNTSPIGQTTDVGSAHSHTYSGTAASTGSGTAHQNMQPFGVANVFIKI